MNYIILSAPTVEKLIALVNEAMNDGWRPLGGVSVALNGSPTHGDCIFVQAMERW